MLVHLSSYPHENYWPVKLQKLDNFSLWFTKATTSNIWKHEYVSNQQKGFVQIFSITSAVDNWFIDNLFNISLSPPIIQNRSDSIFSSYSICDVLRDLVLFVQFKKREKHPLRSITFSKVAGFLYNLKNVKNTHGGMLLLVK